MPRKAKVKAEEPATSVACNTVAEVYARLEQLAAAKDRLSSGKPVDWETWFKALCAEKRAALTPAQKAEQARQIKEDGLSHHDTTQWPWNL